MGKPIIVENPFLEPYTFLNDKRPKMCQRAKVYLMVILLLSYASGAAAFAGNNLQEMKVLYREIKVLINGKELKSSVQPFMIENSGTVMVPLRAMAEALQQR